MRVDEHQEMRSKREQESSESFSHTYFNLVADQKCQQLVFSPLPYKPYVQRRPAQEEPTEFEVRRFAAMVGIGLFDLEDQFAFYGAYHSNKVNVMTHVICVWPLLFGGLIALAYTQPLALPLPFMAALPLHEYMTLNYCFVACAVYALFFASLEFKSGSLAALLVLCCWIAANAVAQNYPYTTGMKIAAIIEVVGWTAQFITHGFYEKRSPALVENLVQACLLAPYFVMLEVLHSVFHYEPYTGFHKNVQYLVNQKKAEFRAKKTKAAKKSA